MQTCVTRYEFHMFAWRNSLYNLCDTCTCHLGITFVTCYAFHNVFARRNFLRTSRHLYFRSLSPLAQSRLTRKMANFLLHFWIFGMTFRKKCHFTFQDSLCLWCFVIVDENRSQQNTLLTSFRASPPFTMHLLARNRPNPETHQSRSKKFYTFLYSEFRFTWQGSKRTNCDTLRISPLVFCL